MSAPASSDEIFLVTADSGRSELFQGYFYSGRDYVFGEEGAAEYRDATGSTIESGLDGCYAVMTRRGDTYRFDVDHAGYQVLYYFHNGQHWAVSNSFESIVNYLTAAGVRTVPNYAHLGSICSTNSTNNQLFSWETPLSGVRVAPRGASLVIDRSGARFITLPKTGAKHYGEALSDHVELWVARFETLMADPGTQLSIDLTGGVDSRANFALALMAARRLGDDAHLPRLTCQGDPSSSADARVALELSAAFGLELNGPNAVRPSALTPEQGYRAWRAKSLGVYYPLVVPSLQSTAARVHMSGGGGEVHRDFYMPATLQGFFDGHARRNRYRWLGHEAARDGSDMASSVSATINSSVTRAHYREMRQRFHGGRTPRHAVSFTPLDSRTAETANTVITESKDNGGQFNYDIMYAADPNLLAIDFDMPKKMPTPATLANLTRLRLATDASPGKIWGKATERQSSDSISFSKSARAAPIIAATREAVQDPFVQQFWGEETVTSALDLCEKLTTAEGIGNPVNGHPISAVLTAALVSPER